MARASAWYDGNDMRVRLDELRSSTMASGTYLDSSTGVTVEVWQADSTASTSNKVQAATNMPYVTASDGRYDVTIQSTGHSMSTGTLGMAIIKVEHSGLTGEWRPEFLVQRRFQS